MISIITDIRSLQTKESNMSSLYGSKKDPSEIRFPSQLDELDILFWAIIQHNPLGEKNLVREIFHIQGKSEICLKLHLEDFDDRGTPLWFRDELWSVDITQFAYSPDGWLISLKRKAPNDGEPFNPPEGVNEFTITNMHKISYV